MKKILLLLVILTAACKTTKNGKEELYDENYIPPIDFAGHLNQEEVDFLKENYPWAEGKILVINFTPPGEECHYDNYVINLKTKRWWSDFYSKIDMSNCSNIFVYSEGERIKRHLNNTDHFDDKNNFLYDNYFGRKKGCDGVMVLNESGEYLQLNGHYSERQVAKYIEALNQRGEEIP